MHIEHKSTAFVQEIHQNFVLLQGFKNFKQLISIDDIIDS